MNILVINAGSSSLKYQLMNPILATLPQRVFASASVWTDG